MRQRQFADVRNCYYRKLGTNAVEGCSNAVSKERDTKVVVYFSREKEDVTVDVT